MTRIQTVLLAAFVCFLAVPHARSETDIELQQRHVFTLKQKFYEVKARLKAGAPEVAELEGQVLAQAKFLEELRVGMQEHLNLWLVEIEKELDAMRGGKAKSDPLRETLLERATLQRRLIEHRLGFELDKDIAALPAAAEAIRTGAISFRIPDSATPAAVDGVMRHVAKIAPNVQVAYLIQLRILTASGGDTVQLQRVQGLVDALNSPVPLRVTNNDADPRVQAADPVPPPRPPAEPVRPKDQEF